MRYGGITIGPIVETMFMAKKERELWFSSYLFSWMMEDFYKYLKGNGFEIILPEFSNSTPDQNRAVGFFPDRICFGHENIEPDAAYQKIQNAYDLFLTKLCTIYSEVKNHYEKQRTTTTLDADIKAIISGYLQVKWFVTKDSLNIEQVLCYLDNAELSIITPNMVSEMPCDRCRTLPHTIKVRDGENKDLYLCPICAIKYGAQYAKTAVKKTGINEKNRFPSVVEIGAVEIIDEISKCSSDIEQLELIESRSNYYSYFGVLCLDVDNASKHLKRIQDNAQSVHDFSQQLFNFCSATNEIIKVFGGKTIYAGGDDILALVPIRNKYAKQGGMTILNLASEINKVFNSIIMAENPDSQLSVSMGVSIQYLKYPLKDALQTARHCLFNKAKETKNTISVTIRKHAGATFDFSCRMYDLEAYLELFSAQLSKSFLQEGMYYSLANIAPLLAEIPAERIQFVIENYFNESGHKANADQFKELIKFLYTLVEHVTDKNQKEQCVLNTVNLFRLAKLLEEKKEIV